MQVMKEIFTNGSSINDYNNYDDVLAFIYVFKASLVLENGIGKLDRIKTYMS